MFPILQILLPTELAGLIQCVPSVPLG